MYKELCFPIRVLFATVTVVSGSLPVNGHEYDASPQNNIHSEMGNREGEKVDGKGKCDAHNFMNLF